MANIELLREKVDKAVENIEKQNKTIMRHQERLEKLKAKEQTLAPEDMERKYLLYDIKHKEDELTRAINKLETLKATEKKWREALEQEEYKIAFAEKECPPVIKEFLENWKERCFDYYIKHYDEFLEYRDNLYKEELALRKDVLLNDPSFEEYRNRDFVQKAIREDGLTWSFLHNMFPSREARKVLETRLKEKKLDYTTLERRIDTFAGELVLRMYDYRDPEQRAAFLEKCLEQEKKEKQYDLVDRIYSITGSIVDASALRIGAKGDINGVIVGENGMASVETVGAGGYNIQCYHFRTLIHEVQSPARRRGR